MTRNLSRAVDLAVVVTFLVAMLSGLGVILAGMLTAASQADDQNRQYHYQMAMVALGLLCLTLLVLVLVVMRYVRMRLRRSEPAQPTPYVNAWELSGQRFKLPPEGSEQDEDQAEGNDDGDDGKGGDDGAGADDDDAPQASDDKG